MYRHHHDFIRQPPPASRRECRNIGAMNTTANQNVADTTLKLIHSRQHISPKRLGDPGPDREQVEKILGAAGAAPDHGLLIPWRLVIIPRERRHLLAETFAEALVERDAGATEAQKQEAREKAYRGALLVLVIARFDATQDSVHPNERLISAGCAVQSMLLAAHAMGFGAGLSSGRGLNALAMRQLFGLTEQEQPLCFVTVGTVTKSKPPRTRPSMGDYTSTL